jgi:hypothetical protein
MIHAHEAIKHHTSLGQTLNTMSSLARLELLINHTVDGPYPVSHLESTTAAIQSLHDVHLPCLTSFTVNQVTFDERVLRKFLLSHRSTLQSINLHFLRLGGGEQWYTAEEQWHADEERWHAVMALLLDEMTCLDTLHLAGSVKVDLVGRDLLIVGLRNMLGRV